MSDNGYISNPQGHLAKHMGNASPKPETQKKECRQGITRTPLKPKRMSKDEKENAERALAEVWQRDDGRCAVCGEMGAECHHIIPKRKGGRGALQEIVDHVSLRTLLCPDCHRSVHGAGGLTPYDFYVQAEADGDSKRILLMELLINEWAKYIPSEREDLSNAIRARNKSLWHDILGAGVEASAKTVGEFWNEAMKQVETLP